MTGLHVPLREGNVRLEPLGEAHREGLRAARANAIACGYHRIDSAVHSLLPGECAARRG